MPKTNNDTQTVYSGEFKDEVVAYLKEHGKDATMEKYDVHWSSVYRWERKRRGISVKHIGDSQGRGLINVFGVKCWIDLFYKEGDMPPGIVFIRGDQDLTDEQVYEGVLQSVAGLADVKDKEITNRMQGSMDRFRQWQEDNKNEL